ncbi:polycystic kidney disease protein 1-like 2 [Sander lucioperca]|uniref:polycystic kidney disease protein 1-like 2 n=1 Tax=Sander lucioperca TaxID=283035 RepID=UPI00125DC6A5|nr:polycystic kidney disease protein 1-like 2 [Sander lucioperca]
MGMLLRTSVFLWISVGFLSLPEKSEACTGNYSLARCEFVFRNVCFEFVGGSKTWFQARGSCEKRGGELLKVMNSPIKMFLKNITREGNTGNFSWWLGEGVQGQYQEPTLLNADNCTYMKLNPLKLIKTSDCKQRRGFLCTHNVWSSNTKVRDTFHSQ